MGLKRFLEERTGLISLTRRLLYEKVRGGSRWYYIFGSCLVFLFILQAITGIVLAMHYSPSSTQAWGSIVYLQQNLKSGWMIRGLHHWAASFIVILILVHMIQVFVFGAYQRPREANWWSGAILFILTLGMALTGYLLPWDQRGYWSTNVVTNIIGMIPIIGTKLREILIGGSDFGSLTLTHFYGLHVLILPLLFLCFVVLHLFLFRKHGVTPGWWRSQEELTAKAEPFWPRQVFYDLFFSLLIFLALALWVVYQKGAALGPPADPTSNYLARPEWYFLFLYQLLKYFKGPWEPVGTLVLPGLLLIILFTFPFLDRHQNHTPRSRPTLLVVGCLFFSILLFLTVTALREDRSDAVFRHQKLEDERQARAALRLAEAGIPPAGPLAMIEADPLEHGRKLFATHCMNCHALDGLGGRVAPVLTAYLSEAWLEGFLKNPSSPHYYGNTKMGDMPPVNLKDQEVKQLAGYLGSLAGNGPPQPNDPGLQIYQRENCMSCHGIPGKTPGLLLDLTGYGSASWIRSFLEDSTQPQFYDGASEMPPFKHVLSAQELDDLVKLLMSLKSVNNAAEETQ